MKAEKNLGCLPETGFVRLPQILAVFPISRSSWYAGIQTGRFPRPHRLGPRTSAWAVHEIRALMADASSASLGDRR